MTLNTISVRSSEGDITAGKRHTVPDLHFQNNSRLSMNDQLTADETESNTTMGIQDTPHFVHICFVFMSVILSIHLRLIAQFVLAFSLPPILLCGDPLCIYAVQIQQE